MPVDDAFTKVLLHTDGPNASATFTDESGKVWTAHGNAQILTAQSVFGGASANISSSASAANYIDTPDHADFNLSNADFTFDFRLGIASITDYLYPFAQRGLAGDFSVRSYFDTTLNNMVFSYSTNGTSFTNVSWSWTPSINTWYHSAFVRNGANLDFYVNGTKIGSTHNIGTSTINNSAANFSIFSDTFNAGTSNWFLDEFRFSNIARWTANFTPQTVPYGTILGNAFWAFAR